MSLGRPTKLTPELQRLICDTLRRGAYLETAAALAGVDRTTLQDWLRRGGREEDGIYVDFSRAVQTAQAEAEMRDLDRIDAAAAAGVWQASAWRLERKHAGRWGRPGSLQAARPEPEAADDEKKEEPGAVRVEPVRCPHCGVWSAVDDPKGRPTYCAACSEKLPTAETRPTAGEAFGRTE